MEEEFIALMLIAGLKPINENTIIETDFSILSGEKVIGKLTPNEKSLYYFIRKDFLNKNSEIIRFLKNNNSDEKNYHITIHESLKLIEKHKAIFSLLKLSLLERFQFQKNFAIRNGDVIVISNINNLSQLFELDYLNLQNKIKNFLD